MIRWTCEECGFSGLYSAQAGQQLRCRSCNAVAVVRSSRRAGAGQLVIAGEKQGESRSPKAEWVTSPIMIRSVGIALVLLVVAVSAYFLLNRRPSLPPGVIASVNDPRISKAVGLLISGLEVTLPDGRMVDVQQGSGSCFVVSPDGKLITNGHVVQDAYNFSRAPLRSRIEMEENVRLRVKFWVFLDGEQLEASVVHLDDNVDLAILSIPVEGVLPYFRLMDSQRVDRGEAVYALGYPAIARAALSEEEGARRLAKELSLIQALLDGRRSGSPIRQQIEARDLEYSQTDGTISRITVEGSRAWIEHGARIHSGNSGGPLLDDTGRVLGVNTATVGIDVRTKDAATDVDISSHLPILSYALASWVIRDHLSNHVPDAFWE